MNPVINPDSYISIYKHNRRYKKRKKDISRVIAFDMDETLGSFPELEMIWHAIHTDPEKPIYNTLFNELLDLYPEFLRYGVLHIMEFIAQKKKQGLCNGVYIYTNNKYHKYWTRMISDYFNYKLKLDYNLFDEIICAFKINNQQVEMSRTSKDKQHSDFIQCTLLPEKTEICFIDDAVYEGMKHKQVYYIRPKLYKHHLSTEEVLNRLLRSNVWKKIINITKNNKQKEQLLEYFIERDKIHSGNSSLKDMEIDILVAQKLMFYVREFFYLTTKTNKTRKKQYKLHYTLKLRT